LTIVIIFIINAFINVYYYVAKTQEIELMRN